MSNFRKTLPLPLPGKTVDDAVEASLRQHQPRKTPNAGADRHKALAPRPSKLSSSSSNDLRKSPKHGGRRSLPPPAPPSLPPPAPPPDSLIPHHDGRAPNWAAHGRALLSALEEALDASAPSPQLQARIERAHAAWNLDGVSSRQLSHVAHLARRAYDAIRGTSRSGLEAAYADCARVLHLGLPSAMRRRVPLEVVVEAVRTMRREADRWVAVVEATMLFVGWTESNRARAADAIRHALEEHPPQSLSED